MSQHRSIENTAIPYRSNADITSDLPNLVAGSQNLLTSARQLMERRPGFADSIEASPTTFTNVKRHKWFPKWGTGGFYSIVNDITASTSDVYKMLIGTDANYIKIFSSSSTDPFDFEISNDTLFMGNGTDMRKYISGSSTTKWGITAPAAAPTLGTTGTGISAFSGWFYIYTYCNSSTGHESSASPLSLCTSLVTNKTVQVTVVASGDSQVDQIRVYRTTDGGSTDPTLMRELSNSPFSNASATLLDTTADTSLSTRTAPGFTTNDPPPAGSKLCTDATGGRIFLADDATSYFSAQEELPANGSPWECFPSGLDGNSYQFPQEVTAQAPQADGVGIFTRGKIWKIAGNLRNNFIRYGLLDRRGTISVTAVSPLGNSVAWLDTASQVFLDGQEIGFDIRPDIKTIDHTQAYMTMHISGRFHWLMLLDGANGKIYVYDMDTQQWLAPWVLPSSASALSSGENAAGSVVLTVAIGKTTMYNLNTAQFNDAGSSYSPVASISLLKQAGKDEKPAQPFSNIAVETDSNVASKVEYLLDDDPTAAGAQFTDISAFVSDPNQREQGTNLVKKIYQPESRPNGERVAMKITWPTADQSFACYTIGLNDPDVGS